MLNSHPTSSVISRYLLFGRFYKDGKTPVQVSVDKFANELSMTDHGVVVFASSTGNQLSWEDPAWGNSAFIKALDESLPARRQRYGCVNSITYTVNIPIDNQPVTKSGFCLTFRRVV